MVYESDFYTVRRPYSRPNITSYSVTSPRHYVVVDSPDRSRRAEEQYSYSYNSNSETVRGSGAPSRNYSSSNETVTRSTAGGPSAYSYSTERSSRSSDYPGSYHSSYSSTTSGRLPHGTTYRHYSYRSPRISVTTWKVKPSIRTSVLIGELDRIYHRSRPHLSYVPTEDFLNSRPLVDFDDETKSIRAETERIMKRIYTPVPHPRTATTLPILPYYGQHAMDKYHSPRHHNSLTEDIYNISHYNEPSARTIGRGHLACVSFAGGRGYPRRKHLYSDENRDISDEIKFRSYYNRNRSYEDAMSLPTGFASYLLRLQPDNRNGTLTGSEKLHIMSILKERKEKNNSAGVNKVFTSEIMNGNLVNKPSAYKSNSVDETISSIERETKLNRSKFKDSKPFEKINKELNDQVESSLLSNNLVKETLDSDISSEELMCKEIIKDSTKNSIPEEPSTNKPNLTSPVEEKIIEVNIEQKLAEDKPKGMTKFTRKASKSKLVGEEEKLKNINESEISGEEKQQEIKDIVIESGAIKKEVIKAMEPQLVEATENVDQVKSDNPENVIHSTNSELSSVEKKDEFTINKEDSTSMLQETNSINTTDYNNENVEETSLNDSEIDNIDITSAVVPEPTIDNMLTELIADSSEKKDEATNSVQESFTDDGIQETMIESSLETTVESNQVIVSATNQEIIETGYKILTTEQQNILEESTTEEEDTCRTEKISSLTVSDKFSEVINTIDNAAEQTTSEEDKEILPETFQLVNMVKSEDFHGALNTEIQTNLNIPVHEKIIDIEIERREESTGLQGMIEEVPNLGSTDIQKEAETEPLIEEPQSPDSEFICNNNAANEVCEVLSDVPEEL